MTARKIERVSPGDRRGIKADDWNHIADVVEDVGSPGLNIGAPPLRRAETGGPQIVLFKNESEDTIRRFQGVYINGILIDPDQNEADFLSRPAFLCGATPPSDVTYARSSVIISAEKVGPGQIGRGILEGIFSAKIDVHSELHTHVGVGIGSPSLTSSFSGPGEILAKEPGAGRDKRAIINLRQVRRTQFPAIITGWIRVQHIGWRYAWREARLLTDEHRVEPGQGGITVSGVGAAVAGNEAFRTDPSNIADVTTPEQRTRIGQIEHVTEMLAVSLKEGHLWTYQQSAEVSQFIGKVDVCAGGPVAGSGDPCANENISFPRILPFPHGVAVMMTAVTKAGFVDDFGSGSSSGSGSARLLRPVTTFFFDEWNPIDFQQMGAAGSSSGGNSGGGSGTIPLGSSGGFGGSSA